MNNWFGIGLASLYVFAVIGLAEGLRIWRGWGAEFTRKVVHIGVGMLIWLVPLLFDDWRPFVYTCFLFAGLTFLDNRFRFFKAMASKDDAGNLGTFYFPLAAAAVVWYFWGQPGLLVGAIMPLTWGDGMAEVIGRRYGRRRYTIFNHTRSLEGSAAFVGFGALTTMLALLVYQAPAVALGPALAAALVVALAAAVVEAVTISGLDNLTVTATAMLLLTLWPFP